MTLLPAAFEAADALGSAGRYFEAHEALEAFWMKSRGDEKVLLQGLIQLAAGLHRLARDPSNTRGAFYLLDKGLEKLEKTRRLLDPAALDALKTALAPVRASGKAPPRLVFGLRPA